MHDFTEILSNENLQILGSTTDHTVNRPWAKFQEQSEARVEKGGEEIQILEKGTALRNGIGKQLWIDRTGAELRKQFQEVLASRRAANVPLIVKPTKPPKKRLYQLEYPPKKCEIMASCPRGKIFDAQQQFDEENFILTTEDCDQGELPVLILKSKPQQENFERKELRRKPAVVFLHSSYKNKEWLWPLLEAYAARGYISVAIDSRYHGERADSQTCYTNGLVSAWKIAQTMPFIYDTVWDLIKLMDYLYTREDIDCKRIGITGESLGGMHAWFAAAMDPRFAVAVPIIGVQSFGWAIANERWQARVGSIPHVFEAAKEDLGKNSIDAEVVALVLERIAPGLIDEFDAPKTIPAIAPWPLLILNGKQDPRCPVEGLETCISETMKAYTEANMPENFKFVAEEGTGHCLTLSMVMETSVWFDKFLQPDLQL